MSDTNEDFWAGAEVISNYSRAQAIEDGMLVDVSSMSPQAGIKYPVALTRAAYESCVAWSTEDSRGAAEQDEAGRLWDVLMMFAVNARKHEGSEFNFELLVVPQGGKNPEPVMLRAECGPGDTPEPVITIMLPDES